MERKVVDYDDGQLFFWCEGCKTFHLIWVRPNEHGYPVWEFNQDLVRPTIRPSILVRGVNPEKSDICHSFITDGRIQYLGDCTHELKNQTVDLLDKFKNW